MLSATLSVSTRPAGEPPRGPEYESHRTLLTPEASVLECRYLLGNVKAKPAGSSWRPKRLRRPELGRGARSRVGGECRGTRYAIRTPQFPPKRRRSLTVLLRDIAAVWPPTVWVSSFSGNDPLSPNPIEALIQSAQAGTEGVRLTVTEGGREFSTTILLDDDPLRRSVAATLAALRGQPLSQAGEQQVEVEDSRSAK